MPNPFAWIDPLGLNFLNIVKGVITSTGKVTVDGVTFRKNDYFYLENFHNNHFETFSLLNSVKGIFNLDSTYNKKKSNAVVKRRRPNC